MAALALLMTVHFIADFLLQGDWMARNKSKDINALSWHVLVYTLTFIPAAMFLPTLDVGARFLLVTAVAHWLTDFVTSRITSRLWFLDMREAHVTVGPVNPDGSCG